MNTWTKHSEDGIMTLPMTLDLTDRFVIGRRRIKEIFVDETLLKVHGQNYWLW